MTRTFLSIAAAACVAFGHAASAAGDAAAGKEKAAQCRQCHGLDGNGPTPQFPKIGGSTRSTSSRRSRTTRPGRAGTRHGRVRSGIVETGRRIWPRGTRVRAASTP